MASDDTMTLWLLQLPILEWWCERQR